MMENPLVSIITPVKNGRKYLEECIQSVLNQGFSNVEHIFVDGVSTDGTLDILKSYQAKYPARIRFVSEPDNSAGEAWNKGLKMAQGDILGWLGADDTFEPTAISTVVNFFQVNPDAYFVFGDCNYINEKGEIIGMVKTRDFDLNEAINIACYIPCPSAFYRREVIEQVGLIDNREKTGVELDYWIRVGKIFQIYRIKKTLSNFRWRKEIVSKEANKISALEGFRVSRRHGGSILSRRAMIYLLYRSVIFAWVFPFLASIYHFFERGVDRWGRRLLIKID